MAAARFGVNETECNGFPVADTVQKLMRSREEIWSAVARAARHRFGWFRVARFSVPG